MEPFLITLLTGRRPHYLRRTLQSLLDHQWPLDAYMICLVNGGDSETMKVVDEYIYRPIDEVIVTSGFEDIGTATTRLFHYAAEQEHEFVLHLEDDWEASPANEDWLDIAWLMLEMDYYQVRLRRVSEPVRRRHMVTGKPLRWTELDHCRTTPDAHYTLNPSLIRLADLKVGWPAESEQDAQRKFWEAGYRRVAQLKPGIWRHIGDQSLRLANAG